MRWGVRKSAEGGSPRKLKGVRKQYKRYFDDKTEGVTLKKGTTINRIARKGDEKDKGFKYASFKASDKEQYEWLLGVGDAVNVKYKASKALVSPSEKKQVDEFIKLIGDRKVGDVAKTLKSKSKLSTLKGLEKALTKAVEGDPKYQTKTYNKFMSLLYAKELQPIREAYFKKLSKQGYNMIIDSSDKGVVAESPVIIFSGGKSLSFTGYEKIKPAFNPPS
jgi:hypothetical protein